MTFAREQYPATREYPTRPTLEERELEHELMKQKAAISTPVYSGGGGPPSGYGRRPATAQSGTVAQMRRRFSDQNVDDMGPASGRSATPPYGQRIRGMSGTGPSLQQHHEQLQSPVGDSYRRDNRYPPRTSTPQSRAATATPSYFCEKNGAKGSMVGVANGGGYDRSRRT
ncbi:hypothetical protein BGZ94_004764 [Podila epigama]|nr:hypothetical protein BGZ94_004764 [Podila epigama]